MTSLTLSARISHPFLFAQAKRKGVDPAVFDLATKTKLSFVINGVEKTRFTMAQISQITIEVIRVISPEISTLLSEGKIRLKLFASATYSPNRYPHSHKQVGGGGRHV